MDVALRPQANAMAQEVRYRALQNLGLLQVRQDEPAVAAQPLAAAGEINVRFVDGWRRALEQSDPADVTAHCVR
jgi:hypothetical protein